LWITGTALLIDRREITRPYQGAGFTLAVTPNRVKANWTGIGNSNQPCSAIKFMERALW
jgi:hypothetical protein